jgi:hypothetical protein
LPRKIELRELTCGQYVKLYAEALNLTTTGLDDNGVLALVTVDEYNFGSAAWFMTTQCATAKTTLATDPDAGWTSFMSCVGVSNTADRQAYWTAAKSAFGL